MKERERGREGERERENERESYINISGPTAAIIPDEVVLERSQRVGVARFEYLDKIAAFPQAEL